MAKFEINDPITAVGGYELPRLIPGGDYLICVKSDTAYTASLQYWDIAANKFRNCDSGSFPDSNGQSEKRFIAPHRRMQILVSSITGSGPITLTFTQIQK